MRLHFASALLPLVVALGCSSHQSNPQPPVDAGTTSLVGHTCSVDAECGALRCDTQHQRCICLSDDDCPGQFCNNYTGQCDATVAGCVADDVATDDPTKHCPAGSFCNAETRACQQTRGFCESCHTDQECGKDNFCLQDASLKESFCAKSCAADADCPTGTTCQNPDGSGAQCIPVAGTNCKTFTGCTPDSLTSCGSSSDCEQDQLCDAASGKCVARIPCPLGTVCDPDVRVCVNSCSVDRDCSSDGSLACVNHLCRPLAQCTSDSDCPVDKVCDVPPGATGGTCVAYCASDAACGVGRVCQPVLEADGSTRFGCLPGCVQNSDCRPDQLCEDQSGALFVAADGGGALGHCAGTYGGKQACQSTDACGTCQVCGTSHSCSDVASAGYCQICDITKGNADCAAFGTGATCLSLAGRDPNTGAIYGSGPYGCGVPCGAPGSVDNASCPKGFVCAALTDANGNNSGVYNCVPSDFDCGINTQAQKCQ